MKLIFILIFSTIVGSMPNLPKHTFVKKIQELYTYPLNIYGFVYTILYKYHGEYLFKNYSKANFLR